MITGNLKEGNKVTLSIAPKKADQTDATVDGVPVWTNSGAGELTPAEDGKSAVLRKLPIGETANVHVAADADLDGDEVRELTEDFVVLGRSNEVNEASELGATIGTEEPDTEA